MASLAIPRIESRLHPDRDARLARLRPIPHSPESMDGILHFDEEFQMAASDAHRKTTYLLGALLDRVAQRAGLRGVGDYPIWYWFPEADEQRILYPDFALTANLDIRALTARELLLVLEVVTTSRREKELKDTVRMREYNRFNGVPEFVLLYPEPEDPRSVIWHRYDPATNDYHRMPLPADRRYRSQAIPGLEIEALQFQEWTEGRKVRVWFRGEELRDSEVEARLRAAAEQQAAHEAQRAEQETRLRAAAEQQAAHEARLRATAEQQAVHETQRAARLAERLRALGIDPDAV